MYRGYQGGECQKCRYMKHVMPLKDAHGDVIIWTCNYCDEIRKEKRIAKMEADNTGRMYEAKIKGLQKEFEIIKSKHKTS